MRKAAISAAVILSALALAVLLWRIEPLLPERGHTACFAANYDPPRPIDLSSPRRDKKSVAEIRLLQLAISFPADESPFRDGSRSYDWRYSLSLNVSLTDGRHLSSGAICEWSNDLFGRSLPALSCYIDCEGGSVTVFRKIGQNALSAWFEPGERLRTGQSCDGGGGLFIGAEKEWRRLGIERAAGKRCERLE